MIPPHFSKPPYALERYGMATGHNVALYSYKRKEARETKKKIKKARRTAYFLHKKIEDVITGKDTARIDVKRARKIRDVTDCAVETEVAGEDQKKGAKKCRRKKSFGSIKQTWKDGLLRAINEDEIEIHRYEKLLGFNKRKSGNLPQVFRAEGLDYLLEACNSKKDEQNDDGGGTGLEMDSVEDDIEMFSEQDSNESYEEIAEKDEGGCSLKPSRSTKTSDGSSIVPNEVNENKDEAVSNLSEDIYGRLIDRRTGEVVPSKLGAKEKLSELEQRTEILETQERLKLKKCLRGLVNRLNEHTLVGAVRTFSDVFATSGHNEVKQILFSEISNSIVVGFRLPDRLIIEYAVFIALLHVMVSSEVSSHVVENLIMKLLETIADPPEGKSLENLCVLLAELYNFRVIKVIIVLEIVHHLKEQMNTKCLTCLKVVLSYSGNVMRKRNFDALQKCIAETQSFLSRFPEVSLKEQQLRYIVEEIKTVKNANVRKFTDKVDSTLYDHYVSIYRGLTRKMEREKELAMSVDDVVHASERGRWWLIGSAWLPSLPTVQDKIVADKNADYSTKLSSSLLQLAKKAKMNTAIRRDIFCTIMSSMNEMDAFEKLLKLSLKGQQEREIVHICVHCTLRETTYNPFYSAVIDRLCCYHKRFKLTTQYAVWDRIRDLAELKKWQRTNLALLIVDLLVKRSIGITVLKVVEFGGIDKGTTQFIRRILAALLTKSTQQGLVDIFRSVIISPQHKVFAQGLHIFIHMALKKRRGNIENKLLLSRIEFLDSIWDKDHL